MGIEETKTGTNCDVEGQRLSFLAGEAKDAGAETESN